MAGAKDRMQAAREAKARKRAEREAAAKVKELAVVYRNGGENFERVTPLKFTQPEAAVEFAGVLKELFPLYQFAVVFV